ncbi:MAG: peptidase S58 family protein [Chloroflexi bacterium]|nr:MAG: peptidase S58 [Anaerolineaceae bacterium 4572_32.2]RLC82039.1 MAG: peptidase S58 family protein [Chloroflexota bacterium]RLC82480.1 MAG: peptidase S58 family protein [Chloroflexota bacterium]HEY72473.1 P1 family peptidase [Thermoflexia bacterium]
MHNGITDVAGIKVGHYTDREGITGCTVVLCEEGGVGGVDVRGSAPGTRETDLMRPMKLVQRAHAVLLTGGSAYGLDAAGGVMRWLEEREVGFNVGVGVVPLVPAAVLFDLTIGDPKVRPDADAGYQACQSATDGPVAEGSIGAGTGATVGKLLGPKFATKSGLGTASVKIGKGIVVGAIVAVNAFGDVVDPDNGMIIAGTRKPVVGGFVNTVKRMQGDLGQTLLGFANTTLAVVATNAYLTKEGANKMAQMAHDGLARSIRPVHTMLDGDTIFALATGKRPKKGDGADSSVVGAAAAEVLARAVVRAAQQAESLGGAPAARDLK